MAKEREENAITKKEIETNELAPTGSAAQKQFEIYGAITIAQKFKRNEDEAFAKLMKSCKRSSFAEDASYKFPRGKALVKGPSVNLAREAARIWGNIQYGVEIIRDDDETRQIRGWAWDVETNTKTTSEDSFKKLVQRRGKGGEGTSWVVPDERDLRELTNRRSAIAIRNCILQLLPRDLIEDAMSGVDATLRNNAKKDPDEHKKKLVLAFSEFNVTPEMLEEKLGHPVGNCTPDELVHLRQIHRSIADGNSNWFDYVGVKKKEKETGTLDMGDLAPGKEENRGHGNEGFDAGEMPPPPPGVVDAEIEPAPDPAPDPVKKKRGRPAGSKNGTSKKKAEPKDTQKVKVVVDTIDEKPVNDGKGTIFTITAEGGDTFKTFSSTHGEEAAASAKYGIEMEIEYAEDDYGKKIVSMRPVPPEEDSMWFAWFLVTWILIILVGEWVTRDRR